MAWLREYQFRSTFGGTHEQFLDEPILVTQWLNAVKAVVNDVTSAMRRESS